MNALDRNPWLWISGATLFLVGLGMGFFGNPPVPLSHAFHLVPIGLGGGVGTAVLRERRGPRWILAYGGLALWMVLTVVGLRTSGAPVFLMAGAFNLTRALLQGMDR